MKKFLIIPDVHGTKNWKKVKSKLNEGFMIIFLGDYCDSYPDESGNPVSRDEELKNLKEIIEFKKSNRDKVILLLGNHDLNQYILDEQMSRKARYQYFQDIQNTLNENIDLFDITYKIGDYICSHAGITKTWMDINNIKDWNDINIKFHQKLYNIFGWNGSFDIYGDEPTQGPMWVRPNALFSDMAFPKQIVGHTKVLKAPFKVVNDKIDNLKGKEIIMLDSEKQDCIYEIEC